MRNPVRPDFAHHKATASSIWEALDFISMHPCTLCVRYLPGAVLQGRKLGAEPPARNAAAPGPTRIASVLAAHWQYWSKLPLSGVTVLFAADLPSTKGLSIENHGQNNMCVTGHGTAVLPNGNVASPSLLRTKRVMKYL